MLVYELLAVSLLIMVVVVTIVKYTLYRRQLYKAKKQEVLDLIHGYLDGASPRAPGMFKEVERKGKFKNLAIIPVLLLIGSALSFGAGPFVVDSDGDGLNDAEEVEMGSDSLNPDTDGDGLNDSEEVNGDTNPLDGDTDGDGQNDREDPCPTDKNNCCLTEDRDNDGLQDTRSDCPDYDTNPDDRDNDGVVDSKDECSDTPSGETPDSSGCSASQRDTDGDGVVDSKDECSDTPPGETPDSSGCSASQRDTDGDGVVDSKDECPGTKAGTEVDSSGCEELQKEITNSIGMEMVLIPAGVFDMGSPPSEEGRDSDEGPVHRVKISEPFYIGKYEVTQEQWEEVMGSNPSDFDDCGGDCPVEDVSWYDVQEFINKLNQMEVTDKYHLPTEAEWEYAARAGTQTAYSFGDDASKLGEYAWYDDNSNGKTHPVGQKKPNPWGLYDVHGNVWEWVQDRYHKNYDGAPTDGSAWESGGSLRVGRGGGSYHFARYCRSANRNYGFAPDYGDGGLGFRLIRSL